MMVYLQKSSVALTWLSVGAGFLFPGSSLVGIIYTLEFTPKNSHVARSLAILGFLIGAVASLPFIFQHVLTDWNSMSLVCLGLSFASFTFCVLLMPESPYSYHH